MAKLHEERVADIDESEIILPINLENIKLKTDGYKQIESRIRTLYPGISDESVKEVTRLYVRLKLKEDPIMVAKAVTKVDSSVLNDYSNRLHNEAKVAPSITVSPEKINTSKIAASQVIPAKTHCYSYAATNISSIAVQPNEITISPCQISYEDFRKYTNIESCVRMDILQKFPGKSHRYLQQIDKYIKSHYENDFIKKQRWPAKVKFNDSSIRTLDDLNCVKQLEIDNSITSKNKRPKNEVESKENAENILGESIIARKKANQHLKENISVANINNPKSLKSLSYSALDLNNSQRIESLQHCQNFSFCDVDNFRSSETIENLSCDVNDPLFTNSNGLLHENISTKNLTTNDLSTFKSPQNNVKPDLKLIDWESDDSRPSSSQSNQNDNLFLDEFNQKLSGSQSSIETDIFPISAQIRNQANHVCLNDTLIFRPCESLQNDSSYQKKSSFSADTSIMATNSKHHERVTPERMKTNEHYVSGNISRTNSNGSNRPINNLTGIKLKKAYVHLSKLHTKNLSKLGVYLNPASLNSTNTSKRESISTEKTGASSVIGIAQKEMQSNALCSNIVGICRISTNQCSEVCVNENLALQPYQKCRNDVTLATKDSPAIADNVKTELGEVSTSTCETGTKKELNTTRNVLKGKAVNNNLIQTLATSSVETIFTNSNFETAAKLKANLKEKTADHSKVENNRCTNPMTCIPNLNIAYSNNESNIAKCCQNTCTIKEESDDTYNATERTCETLSSSNEIQFVEVLPSQPIVIPDSDETSENLLAKIMKPSDISPKPLQISKKSDVLARIRNITSKVTPLKNHRECFTLSSIENNITDNAQATDSLTREMTDNSINTCNKRVTESNLKLSNAEETTSKKCTKEAGMRISNHELMNQNSSNSTPGIQFNQKLGKRSKESSHEGIYSVKKRKTCRIESTGATNDFLMAVSKSKQVKISLKKFDNIEKIPMIPKDNCTSNFSRKMVGNSKGMSPSVLTTLSKQQYPKTLRKSIVYTAIENQSTLYTNASTNNSSSNSMHRFSILYRTLTNEQLCWLTNLNLKPILNTIIDHIYYQSIYPISSRHDDPSLKSSIKLWRHKLLIVGVVSNSLHFRLGVNAVDEGAMLSFLDITNDGYSSNGIVAVKALQYILSKFASINISQEIIIINSDYAYTGGEFYIRDEPLEVLQRGLGSISPATLRNLGENEGPSDVRDQWSEIGSHLSAMTTAIENADSDDKTHMNLFLSQHCLDSTTLNHIKDNNKNQAIATPQLELPPSDHSNLPDYANLVPNIKIEPISDIVSNEELNVIRDLCDKLKTEETDEKELELDISLIKSQISQLNELEQICKSEETESAEENQFVPTHQDPHLVYEVNHNVASIDTPVVGEISHVCHAIPSIDSLYAAGNKSTSQQNCIQSHRLNEQIFINEQNCADSIFVLSKETLQKRLNCTPSKKHKKHLISGHLVMREDWKKCNKTHRTATPIKKDSSPKVIHSKSGKIENKVIKKPSKRKLINLVDAIPKSSSNNCLGIKNILANETKVSEHLKNKEKKTTFSKRSETKRRKDNKVIPTKNLDQIIIPQLTHNFRPLNLVCISKNKKEIAPVKLSEEMPREQKLRRIRDNVDINRDPDYFIEDTSQIETNLSSVSNSTMSAEERVHMESLDSIDNSSHSNEVSNIYLLIKPVSHQIYCWMTLMNLVLLNTKFKHIFYSSSLPLLDSAREMPIQSTVVLRRYEFLECKLFTHNLDFQLRVDGTNEKVLFELLSAMKAQCSSEVRCSRFDTIIIRGILQIFQKFRKYLLLTIREEIHYSDFMFSSRFETKSANKSLTILPNIFFEKIFKVLQISRSYN